MKNLRSFTVIICATLALVITLSILTYYSLNDYVEDNKWVGHTSVVLRNLESVVSKVKDAQIAHRGYELTGDSTFLKPYNYSRLSLLEEIDQIDSLLLDNDKQRSKLDSIKNLVIRQFDITDEILSRHKKSRQLDNYAVNLLTFDEENMTKIRSLITSMKAEEQNLLESRTQARDQTEKIAPAAILASFLAAMAVLGYLFNQLYKTIKMKNQTEYQLENNLKLLSEEVNEKEVAQESLKKVLDGSTNGIIFFKAIRESDKIVDFEYRLVNQNIEKLLGYAPEELVGRRLKELFPGVADTDIFNKYIRIVERDENLDTETFYDHDNLNAWYHITGRKLDDGCVITFADITERKKYEKEILNKNQELEESNKNLEQFAYVASHDLQEPLRKVRTFGDRIVSKYESKLDEKGVDYLSRMNGAAERMQLLIDDLLKYSRVTRFPKKTKEVDLLNLCEGIINDLETLINKRKAAIEINGLEIIEGDETQLRQLFQNLISNAIKFTPDERSPKVKIIGKKVRGSEQNDFEVKSNKQYLKISIVDNGIGFDQEYAHRIFNIFERLHGKGEFKGTGIGLAICHKVVQNHGGYIKAISPDEVGATFIILLPIKNKRNHE